MKNFEFISYKKYPDDPYTNAIARVRIDKKNVVVYAQKKTKNGGLFWSSPSVCVTENGEKKYLSAHKLDSEMEQEMLIEFIEDNVKNMSKRPQLSEKLIYPHGLIAASEDISPMPEFPTLMDEVANQQEIQF